MTAAASPWTESTDFVGRFRQLYDRNGTVSKYTQLSTIPPQIMDRLSALNLTWTDLPVYTQEALLWDMGLVRLNNGSGDVQQVYTKCGGDGKAGETMENIMVSEENFLASEKTATTIDCGGYVRQNISNGINLGKYVKCAIAKNPSSNSYSSMWSQDGMNNTMAPSLLIMRHEWLSDDGPPFLIFAIHSVPNAYEGEWPWGSCPSDRPGSLIIPCRELPANTNDMCVPAPSNAMTQWLSIISKDMASRRTPAPTTTIPTSNSSSSVSTVGIVLGVLAALVILGGAWFFIMRRKRRANDSTNSTYLHMGGPNSSVTNNSSGVRSQQPIQTNSHKLNSFQRDPYLCSRRLPYSSVTTTRMLSKGAFGEVWLGTLDGEVVAIKKILDSKRNDETELECFAEEIRLMASLNHPNIVLFKGFAWNTLQNMCCVVEYMRNGDLGSYLAEHHPSTLNWHEKLVLAVGIARALAYLHGLTPKIIHRDLKAKNILVTDTIEAKLSDFGISRERSANETMTAGVGTIFWTAPEVLSGERYSELADVYSFGCVLNELDTHQIPYSDLKGVPPMTIVQRVTSQGLRPSFKPTCPKLVKELADECLAASPTDRPTAAKIVATIERWKGWSS